MKPDAEHAAVVNLIADQHRREPLQTTLPPSPGILDEAVLKQRRRRGWTVLEHDAVPMSPLAAFG